MKTTSTELAVTVGDGLKLTYLVSGEPDAPPLVLVHALSTGATDWATVTAALSAEYRVFAVNQRGHGSSDWPGEYSFELMAQDLAGFLDALELERPILVGHSLGGIVSYFVAATHPDRIAALVLEEGPPPQVGGERFDFGPRPKGKLSFDWQIVAAVEDHLNDPDPGWWNLASRIAAPTLVISGGPSSHVPEAWEADLAARIPNGRLVTLAGGHFVHDRHPQRFIAEVTAFLAGLNRESA